MAEKRRTSLRNHDYYSLRHFQSNWALETHKLETWILSQFMKMRPYESIKFCSPLYESTKFSKRLVCFGRKEAYGNAKPWVLLVGSFPIKLGSRNAKIRNSKIAATYENATIRKFEFWHVASVFWQKRSVGYGEAMTFIRWGISNPIGLSKRTNPKPEYYCNLRKCDRTKVRNSVSG